MFKASLVATALGVFVATATATSSLTQTNGILGGSQGPLAESCGAPQQAGAAQTQTAGARGTPVFPAGQYPVKLPSVSLLGARNDLPNPFQPGVHWGQLPTGRKWGSTAGVYASPDGKTIWAIDRCGASGAGGTACLDSPFDPGSPIRLVRQAPKEFWQGFDRKPSQNHSRQGRERLGCR